MAVKGTLSGVVLVGALLLLVAGAGREMLPAELQAQVGGPYFWSGLAVGVLSAAIGNVLIAYGSMKAPEDRANSTGFLRAVVLDFALQFSCAAACILGLIFKGLKFQPLAAFGITFALAVVVCRMCGTVLVSRALVARFKQRIHDPD